MPAGGRVRPSGPLHRREGRLLTTDGGCRRRMYPCLTAGEHSTLPTIVVVGPGSLSGETQHPNWED